MKTIEIVVALDGKTRIQTRGFEGANCLPASRWLEAALGRTTSDRLSSEYYAAALENAPNRVPAQGDAGQL